MSRRLVVFLVLATLSTTLSLAAQNASEVPDHVMQRIKREVRHEILSLPEYGVFDNIAFKVEGYQVTIMGQVTRPILKTEVENVVKQIEGVQKVVNQIEVLPPSTMDDGLRLKLFRAIYGFPSLEHYALPVIKPIRIIVKSGNVTLEGVVNSEADKNVAALRANTVPGIFAVTNNLRVRKS